MYKCAYCNEKIVVDINTVGVKCAKCGFRIFIKERPNVKKVIKAR
ncbi:MAG: DNA-directed RNA polymerase subunit P [Candidatus Thermoplasmatota archaeon]